MSTVTKKFRSNWFRVATAGATSDGRNIEASWIQEMAKSYSPSVYGARIWMEHIRGTVADSPFRAYGDVVAVKAEEVDVEINGTTEKRVALFAQIEPTPDLVAMTKAKQKIYTSIEVNPKFADTGKAYLVGLGVTDSPASLGTDVLSFAAQNPDSNPYKGRKQSPENLFAASVEVELNFEEVEDKPSAGAALLTKISELFRSNKASTDGDLVQIGEAVTAVAEQVKAQETQFADGQKAVTELAKAVGKLTDDFSSLLETLGKTPDTTQPNRPAMTGGNGLDVTDC
ncbi:GPO family capsid scaffolding protein [Pseudomonas sp. Marseille-Q5115]|uniref:GPO family capsid scaffolding protein n=1 Tax=Pseudomonas sp. Marseille-Q5115 TaxID=2866593 RepID=UPI001CE40C1C|nr:GPO family capsid scaffolding protein [Pseudomonas sp. Marseille-Q5115]